MRLRKRVSSLSSGMGSVGSLASKSETFPSPQVDTQNGIVQGRKLRLKSGFLCDTFQGIPYAEPPIGELRFQKPKPKEKWSGVLKCSRYRHRSIQKDMFWEKVTQSTSCSEDCLYLNVFAPTIEPEKKYPVVYYIHGGGFMMDSPARLVPSKICRQIVERGIVLVTVTYRLGYLGFFSTGDEACKGNMGLYDQAFALKWTKENIGKFGGDSNDITVVGQSAGGVSTDLLSLSPLTRDLFQKKVVMGGNSFCYWATTSKEEISDYCRIKAQKLGWKPQKVYDSRLEENEDMMRYLRTIPAHKFATTMHMNEIVFSEARLPLAPVLDDEILPKPLDQLREEAPKMESIVGVGEQESLLFAAIGFLKCGEKDLEHALRMIAKKSANFGHKEVCDIVNELYGEMDKVKGKREEVAKLYVTLISDVISNFACYQYMKHSQSHDKSTYAFSYDYTSKWMYGWLGLLVPFKDGTHASDIIYLMDVNYFSSPWSKNKEDQSMCEMTADYFTSFIKTGNPNSEKQPVVWDSLSKDGSLNYLSFDLEPRMKNEIFNGRMEKVERIAVEMKMEKTRNLEEVKAGCSDDGIVHISLDNDRVNEIENSIRPKTIESQKSRISVTRQSVEEQVIRPKIVDQLSHRKNSFSEKKKIHSPPKSKSNAVAPIEYNERLIS
ncbi:unnamed protein product, partial [Mesorhabditis belari]|uniref:Carboxylic ester hydrolase n=1 Tax=Mesorhabditis belari TaxID=2138241 RepID=A0AAF3F2P9_9BILA